MKASKRTLKPLCLLLAPLMTFSFTSRALAQEIPVLDELETITFTPELSNQIAFEGLYRQKIETGEEERELLVYLPEGTRKQEYFLNIALPAEADAESFLSESGWIQIADAEHLGLRVYLPGEDGWKSYEEEAAYISAANNAGGNAFFGMYYSSFGADYLYGVGEGAAILEQWAAGNPRGTIAGIFLDANLTSEELTSVAGQVVYGDDMTTIDSDADLQPVFLPVSADEVPVPVWIAGADETQSYWEKANDCFAQAEAYSGAVDAKIYYQDKETSNAIATSYTDAVSQVRVSETADAYSQAFNEEAYSFLRTYTRDPSDSVYASSLTYRLDEKKAAQEGRYFEIFDFVQTVDNSDNPDASTATTDWMRNYIVYVPEQCTDYEEVQYPVVYFFPGGSDASQRYFENTDCWQIADKYGFIAVVPSAVNGWNLQDGSWPPTIDPETGSVSDDIDFVDKLFTAVQEQFHTDQGRVFITGLSMGGIFCNYLGMQLGDRITAIGDTSGPIFGAEIYNEEYSVGEGLQYMENATDNLLPYMQIMGSRDNWPIYVGEWTDEAAQTWYSGQMHNNNPNRFNDVYYSYMTQSYWTQRNGVDFDSYEIVEKGLTADGQLTPAVEYNAENTALRYTTYQWKNSQGIPVTSWSQSAGRSHCTAITDYEKVWTDWFVHFTMDSDGNRYYDGTLIEE